ncbi:MAG: winged-helix domain-containing protein [Coriobacteriia bacterium]|nr:winged-helix domain-containing protein [Coriobacteriia bacterium]
MSDRRIAPDATLYRLSLYHCYLGELLRTGAPGRITSREIAEELGIKEETVRRDISFVGDIGRPGAGYEPDVLFREFTVFLGLSAEYPIIKIGSAAMLAALEVVFPPDHYGVKPFAYYSELLEDVGKVVGGIEVHHITELPKLDPALGIDVALVACSPAWVQVTLDLLDHAGVRGVLLLTSAVRINRHEDMFISQVRMPCDIKSLACKCHARVGAVGSR